MNKTMLAVLLAAGTLSACKVEETREAPAEGSGSAAAASAAGSIPAALRGGNLRTTADALDSTGLASVFAGAGSYTLFAPSDAAITALGTAGKDLAKPEQRPALAALLREHIVPGYLSTQDIGRAIDAAKGKPVKMRSLGTGELTFAREGSAITVSSTDGARAKLAGDALRGNASAAIPINGVLKKI